MPSQLAIDLTRSRVRAVEVDGTAKAPRIKAFVAADVPAPPPPAEGEATGPPSYSEGLRDLASQRRFVRDPAGVALASVDCTFRELELPFTSPDQIDKVIKFEAESHLQLVEIDSVVVSYQLLDRDGRGGSKLLAAACAKDAIRGVLRDLGAISVDPQFADLHLTALYTALVATGYLAPAPPAQDAAPGAADEGEVVLVLECDPDLTHLLIARGDTLLAARAIRLGAAAPAAASGAEGAEAQVAEAGTAAAEHRAHDHDETMVVVDDLGGAATDEVRARRGGGDYFTRLRREVQRTLFRLGPQGEKVSRVLAIGAAVRVPGFVERLQSSLGLPVEVARPFDQVEHDLDEEEIETANAEGVAALGVALRLLGVSGSRVDFRQEEVRYARRFDQVKVALSCLAIVALVCVALLCIERAKRYRVKRQELFAAASAVLNEHAAHAENTRELTDKVNEGELTPVQAVRRAKNEIRERYEDLSSELGRSGTIPRLASGLDYLNAMAQAIQQNLEEIGRIEITTIDLDITRQNPSLKLRLLLNGPQNVDALCAALRASPAVKLVPTPNTQGAKDGRLEVTNLDIELKPDYDPRRGGKEATP